MRGRWELSDAQWELIEPILRPKRRIDGLGRPWQDTRAVLNGIPWVLGTGAQWREVPNKIPDLPSPLWVREGRVERFFAPVKEASMKASASCSFPRACNSLARARKIRGPRSRTH